MTKYSELLQQDEKKKDAAMISERVETAKLEIGNAKLQCSRAFNQVKSSLNAAKSSTDFNPELIIELSRELLSLEQDMVALTTLEKEMF
jgi:hypothetical protein